MTYRIKIEPQAFRELSRLAPVVRRRVTRRIDALINEPRPPSSIPLAGGLRGGFRLRVGDYRVAYTIDDEAGLIRVWAVGHRRIFYDDVARRQM